jgi:hypothetical protein
MPTETLACACGRCRIELSGRPIVPAECHCESCRAAALRLEALPGAAPHRAGNGGVPYVLWRKDRVRVAAGEELLAALRLAPGAKTRRVVATCCNTPVFLDFEAGHWLSLYVALWPEARRPPMRLRTMTKDLGPARADLPDDTPNPPSHTAGFMLRLVGAWIAMKFRSPPVARDIGELAAHG